MIMHEADMLHKIQSLESRIDSLERAVMCLLTTTKDITEVVNTGSYHYELKDLLNELRDDNK